MLNLLISIRDRLNKQVILKSFVFSQYIKCMWYLTEKNWSIVFSSRLVHIQLLLLISIIFWICIYVTIPRIWFSHEHDETVPQKTDYLWRNVYMAKPHRKGNIYGVLIVEIFHQLSEKTMTFKLICRRSWNVIFRLEQMCVKYVLIYACTLVICTT